MEPCNEEAREAKYFKPPLWRQRRSFAVKAIKQSNTESVADFGCGEGALLEILLNSCQFSRIAGVDIDTQALSAARVLCRPRYDDFRYLRELPLRLSLYHGSVTKLDSRLQNYECITMLEVIEHMEQETLEKVSRSVFGGYQPKMVIISTPNAEFNVNFNNLCYGTPQSQFRHWDHRFEWTRQEFSDW